MWPPWPSRYVPHACALLPAAGCTEQTGRVPLARPGRSACALLLAPPAHGPWPPPLLALTSHPIPARRLPQVALVMFEVVVWPVHDLRAVDRRLAKWADAHAAAFAQAACNEAALDSQSSGGSAALIKAHNRAADADAYVQAAAAARTLSAVQQQQQRQLASPQRMALTLPALPALSRAPTAPASLPPLSPYRQASPHRPPLPSPPRSRQPLLPQAQREQPSAPPLAPSQLFP